MAVPVVKQHPRAPPRNSSLSSLPEVTTKLPPVVQPKPKKPQKSPPQQPKILPPQQHEILPPQQHEILPPQQPNISPPLQPKMSPTNMTTLAQRKTYPNCT